MKKKIVAITLLFMLIFSSTVFAQTFATRDNIKPNKIWTITFNRDIKRIRMSIKDEKNRYIPCMVYMIGKQATIVPFSDYTEGEYILNIESVTSADDVVLTEVANMKFIIKE